MAVMHLILQETQKKNISAKLTFLSSASKVVEWTLQVLTSGGNHGNSTSACTLQ